MSSVSPYMLVTLFSAKSLVPFALLSSAPVSGGFRASSRVLPLASASLHTMGRARLLPPSQISKDARGVGCPARRVVCCGGHGRHHKQGGGGVFSLPRRSQITGKPCHRLPRHPS